MRAPFSAPIVVTAFLLLCLIGFHHASAKVVQDGKGAVSNPAVEAGGHRLSSQPDPKIQYSMVGAIASEGNWIMQCALWPWRQFGSLGWFRHRGHGFERHGLERFGEHHSHFVPVP